MVTKLVNIDLEEAREHLRKAKSEQRPGRAPSLRDAIVKLLPEIDDLKRSRWSDAQISEFLLKIGISISPGTLAQYTREARKAAPEQATEHKPRKSAKGSGEASKASAEPVPEGQSDIESFIGTKASDAKPADEKPKAPEQKVSFIPNAAAATTTRRRVNDDA